MQVSNYNFAIYIHSNKMNDIPTRVSKYSYIKNNPGINIWIDNLEEHPNLLNYHNQSFYRDENKLSWDSTKHQAFFPVRFLCVETHKNNLRKEKWILIADPDIFCLKDLSIINNLIFEAEVNNLDIISVNGLSSMMIVNTEKIDWTESNIIDYIFVRKSNFNNLMLLRSYSQLNIPEIFNHHDVMDSNTYLLHTSNTETQPWKTGIRYNEWELHNKIKSLNSEELIFQEHPSNLVKKTVFSLFAEAYQNNLFDGFDIDNSIKSGALRTDIKRFLN